MKSSSLLATLNHHIALVRAGCAERIAMPGRWVVWMPEGAVKPCMRFFR